MANTASRSLLLSPPISPYTRQKDELDKNESDGVRDPPLFSRSDPARPETNVSLFPEAAEPMDMDSRDAVIAKHMAHKAPDGTASRPSAAEYAIVADTFMQTKFKSMVYEECAKDPARWLKREMGQWDYYLAQGPSKDKKVSEKKRATGNAYTSYRKLAPAHSGIKKPRVPVVPRVRNSTKPKRTPPQKVYNEFSYSPLSPSVSKTPKAVTSRDDVDFESIPDYCPPTFSIKSLKADWKGTPLPLENDPHLHLLHAEEAKLASTLRLTCATYLCSKRRIFLARHNAIKTGKSFRKTDAQQACKIDVNKASKLWTAFDKNRWFE